MLITRVVVERRTGDDRREEPRGGRRAADFAENLEDTRCRQCKRLLCRNTREALRSGHMIEFKCGSCNTLNFLVGRDDEEIAQTA